MNPAARPCLFVLPTLACGGAERVALNLLNQLHARRHPVELIVFDRIGNLASEVPPGVKIHDLGTITLRRSLISLIFKIRSLRPKVIFSTLGYVNLGLLFIRPLLPKTTSLWIREANLPSLSLPNSNYPNLLWWGYRLLYRYANRILSTSERMHDELIETFHVPPSKIRILPNPVNELRIRSVAGKVKRPPGKGVRFVAAGRLTEQKGFDRLLLWFSRLENKSAHLLILGDGLMEQKLKALAGTLGISDQVTFAGFVDEPWPWLAGADAFLLPSRWEGMPNVALEALACGTPVIATPEAGGIIEVAQQTKNDAMRIASGENEFISAMRNVRVMPTETPRPSFLPQQYQLDSVIDCFERWLKEVE